jgi:Tol biopolymer transport system component
MPMWSPDGSRIAFTSICGTDMEELSALEMTGQFMLYVMGADGSSVRRLSPDLIEVRAVFTSCPAVETQTLELRRVGLTERLSSIY